jgi:hypothetical protein
MTTADLENKLLDFRTYFNNHRTHDSGRTNAGYVRVSTNRKSPLDSLATALSSPVPDAGGRLIDQRLALAAVFGRPLQNFLEIVHCFPIAKHFPDRFPATRCDPAFRK